MAISNSKFRCIIIFMTVFFTCCENNEDGIIHGDSLLFSLKGDALQNSKMYLVREGQAIDSTLLNIESSEGNDTVFNFRFSYSGFIQPIDTIYNSSYPNINFHSFRLRRVKSNGTPYLLEYEINGINKRGRYAVINMNQLIE